MRLTIRRTAALAVGSALSLSGLTGLASPASADPSPSGTAAASWLTKELPQGVFGDYCAAYCGTSIDAALSFHELGDTAGVAKVRDAVASQLTDYSDYDYSYDSDNDSVDEHYQGRSAGAVAKEIVLAQTAGANPRSFGTPTPTDLVARLEAMVGSNGRIANQATKDGANDPDSAVSNTISQSFAARGLHAAGSGRAASATSYLLAQQCPSGYFRGTFPAANADTSCTVDQPSPGADATAYAVIALQDQLATPAVRSSVDRAVAWLATNQGADGSFASAEGAKNTNSTGLAGWALGESCRVDAANRAAAYVRTLQVPATAAGALAADRGAIAFTADQFSAAQTSGIPSNGRYYWWGATAQAAASLGWDPTAAATVQLDGPAKPVKGGDDATVTITGAAAGERVCVTGPNGAVSSLVGNGGPLSYTADTRKKDDAVTVTATTGPGSASTTVEVLGKEKLKPAFAKTVKQGARAAVKLKGLGAKEKVKVYVDGKLVAKGRATKKGVYKDRFLATFKLGTHKLKVVGQYQNRVGTTTFRVVA